MTIFIYFSKHTAGSDQNLQIKKQDPEEETAAADVEYLSQFQTILVICVYIQEDYLQCKNLYSFNIAVVQYY